MSVDKKRASYKRIRLFIDIAMSFMLPMLMAYSLIGEMLHEIIGTLMLVLFVLHHAMNRKWYPALFKGKYDGLRIFRTCLDTALLAIMLIQPISGILMSKYLYTFIDVPGIAATVREIHLVIAYWGFVLMSVHAFWIYDGSFRFEKDKTNLVIGLGKLSRYLSCCKLSSMN